MIAPPETLAPKSCGHPSEAWYCPRWPGRDIAAPHGPDQGL